jgi:hypothetical protein
MGAAAGDINNDGLPDLYLTNLGSNQMYLNKGDGKFVDVTKESGADDPRWSTSASFFDYDRDGWLDLMIVNYADFSVTNSPNCYAATTARDYCTPRVFRAPGNRLLHNKGNGVFEDVTVVAGVSKEFGHGLGVVTADFNDDGWIDIRSPTMAIQINYGPTRRTARLSTTRCWQVLPSIEMDKPRRGWVSMPATSMATALTISL